MSFLPPAGPSEGSLLAPDTLRISWLIVTAAMLRLANSWERGGHLMYQYLLY
jgi:hypothetical protein